jgi:voltage-gated potassium channel
MTLLQQAGAAVLLVLITVCLQCAGVAALITWLRSIAARGLHDLRMFHSAALVMQTTVAVIILHGIVILLWASCYRGLCFPSWESAFYFSASSYTTVGYGDVVLPLKWHLLGPLESMVGMLMSGISVGLLFAVITHLVEGESRFRLPLRSEPVAADHTGL